MARGGRRRARLGSFRSQRVERMSLTRRTVLALLGIVVVPASLLAQSDGDGVLRTSWGEPDLDGFWWVETATPLERPEALGDQAVLTDEEAAAFIQERRARAQQFLDAQLNADWGVPPSELVDGRTSLIVDPSNGRIPPRTEAGSERFVRPNGEQLTGPEDRPLFERCIQFVAVAPVVGAFTVAEFFLFQTPDHIVIHVEHNHEVRIIPLDGRPPLPPVMAQWRGESRGRWEGDTLVVETTNFHPQWTFQGAGPNLRLTERFTRTDEETLTYGYTVDDPESFTAPWSVELPLQRREDARFLTGGECHEGNRSIPLMLRGARAEEAAATDESPQQ